MQIFELESLFFSSIKLTLENRDASIELKEDIGIFPLEIFDQRIMRLQQNSRRILNVIRTSFRPVICIFDDYLIQRISDLLLDMTFDVIVCVNTFFNVLDVFNKLLHLRDTTFLLNLFDETLLQSYYLTNFKIL